MLSVPLNNPSLAAVMLFCAVTAMQFWRMRNEERVLMMVFPEYAEYAKHVPMIWPKFLTPSRFERCDSYSSRLSIVDTDHNQRTGLNVASRDRN
jgi:hypothetical protein